MFDLPYLISKSGKLRSTSNHLGQLRCKISEAVHQGIVESEHKVTVLIICHILVKVISESVSKFFYVQRFQIPVCDSLAHQLWFRYHGPTHHCTVVRYVGCEFTVNDFDSTYYLQEQ